MTPLARSAGSTTRKSGTTPGTEGTMRCTSADASELNTKDQSFPASPEACDSLKQTKVSAAP